MIIFHINMPRSLCFDSISFRVCSNSSRREIHCLTRLRKCFHFLVSLLFLFLSFFLYFFLLIPISKFFLFFLLLFFRIHIHAIQTFTRTAAFASRVEALAVFLQALGFLAIAARHALIAPFFIFYFFSSLQDKGRVDVIIAAVAALTGLRTGPLVQEAVTVHLKTLCFLTCAPIFFFLI